MVPAGALPRLLEAGQGLGLGLGGGTQHVPADRSSLQDPPYSCKTQMTPVLDKAGIFCLALQHGTVDDANAGNTDSQGLICRQCSCLTAPATPPAAPGHSPAAPRLRQAHPSHSQAPVNILPFSNSSTQGFSQLSSMSNPTHPSLMQGCCLPSGTLHLQLSPFSILPQKVVNTLFFRASRSRGKIKFSH